jgi:hypothetical protein
MTNFYCAPDGTVDPAVTLVATGTANYGKGWNTCAKWSDFLNATNGLWYGSAFDGTSDDVIYFYPGVYKTTAITGGWPVGGIKVSSGADNFPYVNMQGQWPNGMPGYANFVGTRTWPWPYDASSANPGEDWMTYNLATSIQATFKYIHWQNLDFLVHLGAPLGNSPNMGSMTMDHCLATNFEGGFYASSSFDGMHSVTSTNCFARGYTRGWARTFGSYNITDAVFDSEFQSTTRTGSAASTFGCNAFDVTPWASSTTWPCSYLRVVTRNHAAGTSVSNYLQGDGQVSEENAGWTSTIDCYTEGNGDRGWDWKCPGVLLRCVARKNGYGFGHHNDYDFATVTQCLFDTGYRDPNPAANGLASASVQAVGATRAFKSVFRSNPTAAQVTALHAQSAGADYCIYDISVAPSSFQHDLYSSVRRGQLYMTDCYEMWNATNGAVESHGGGSGDNSPFQNIPVFGSVVTGSVFTNLNPNTAYTLKGRGVDATGAAGPYSATSTWTTGALLQPATMDLTKPASPTGLTVTGTTATTVTFTFNTVPQDSGTAIYGYMPFIKLQGDSVPIMAVPACSASPFTIYSLPPGNHTLYLSAWDGTGNFSDLSTGVPFTITNSPAGASLAAPAALTLAVGITTLSGTTLRAPRMIGVSMPRSGGAGTPAVVGATYYEVADNASGVTYARAFPTTASYQTTIVKTHCTTMTL